MNSRIRIKIIGAGPTGLILAHGLSNLGCYIDIVDVKEITELSNSERVYALTHSSRRLFEQLLLWKDLEQHLTRFSNLIVSDVKINRTIILKDRDLRTYNKAYEAIGWTIEHSNLVNVILSKIKNSKKIQFKTVTNNQTINDKYDLSIACDGQLSPTRSYVDIKSIKFNYSNACAVSKVLLRGVPKETAYECFRKDGPLAILPVKGDLYNILWTIPTNKITTIANYTTSQYLDVLNTVIPRGLEVDCLIGKRYIVPLSFSLATRIFKSKVILAGESSHSLHPVGGQGLNLSIRDIHHIYNVIKYRRFSNQINLDFHPFIFIERISDIILTSLITNLLLFVFSNNNPILKIIRNLTFYLLKVSSLFRRIVLSIMTDGPTNLLKSQKYRKSTD